MNYTYAPEIKAASIGTLSVLDIVTNSIVIAVIVKYPQLREDRTNLFMLSLMISDILYGTFVMPLSAVLCSSASQSVLAAMPYLANVHMVCVRWLATTSLNSLSWVTMCKMIAITKPFVYDRHVNSYRCGIIIALIWSIGFLIGIATLRVDINWNNTFCLSRITASSAADSITTLSFLTGITIPVILIVYGTGKIFLVIVRTHRQITSQVQSISGCYDTCGQPTSATLQSIRSGKNVLIICASIVIIVMPTIIYDMHNSISGDVDDLNLFRFFMMWIAPCNTVVNSILFVFLFRSVRNKTGEMMINICACIP